ncbi:hypothetical protein Taro_043801 [Colocasia esculenta]|uniref:Uncharacterized protein n=1 Tax=Colocasia esculenta TaxID=4460 RepID=A0A843WKA7_COLES|nr:hypothetical protein [Colocasia esculenta]
MAGMSEKARKWQERPRKPGNGRDVPESQEMAGMSQKARKWQECLGKSGNGRDVRESQEMARMSKQTKKRQKQLENSIKDGDIENYSEELRNDGKNPKMSANGRSGVRTPGLSLWLAIPDLGIAKKWQEPLLKVRKWLKSPGRSRNDPKALGSQEMTSVSREVIERPKRPRDTKNNRSTQKGYKLAETR